MKDMKVVVCLTTYNRVDCAKISTEIIKLNWHEAWPIVHACSAQDYVPALEDKLLTRSPLPLTTGAFDLLTSSIVGAIKHFDADYVIHLEGDTWVFDQRVLLNYLEKLQADDNAVIAASSWSIDYAPSWRVSRKIGRRFRYLMTRLLRPLGSRYGIRERKSLSTQFFIAKSTPAFVDMLTSMVVKEDDLLEKVLYRAVNKRFGKGAVIPMEEREPMRPDYRNSCPALHLVCQHWPEACDTSDIVGDIDFSPKDFLKGKKESLAEAKLPNSGPNMRRLLDSDDLRYYNGSAKRY